MAKLKVGDWATIVGSKLEGAKESFVKVHILEVLTQWCEAGIEQTSYMCRLFAKGLRAGWEPASKEIRFREMELEKRKEPIEE